MKPWIDLNSQVQKHVGRGLQLGDTSAEEFALFLYSNNYYRVSGYSRCFYDSAGDRYRPGVTASQLMHVYDLDRRVRNAVLEGISVVEPVLRSRVVYHVAQHLRSVDAYLDHGLYLPKVSEPPVDEGKGQQRWHKQIENRDIVIGNFRSIQERREIFIQHHVVKGEVVPLWAAVEVVSFGTFSRFLRALADKTVLAPVVRSFGVEDDRKFLQAVQNLVYLRNIAAHHGRLWNRRFEGYMALPEIALRVKRSYLAPKTPAAGLTLLAGLVDQVEKDNGYSQYLLGLVHSDTSLAAGYYRPVL